MQEDNGCQGPLTTDGGDVQLNPLYRQGELRVGERFC